MSSERKDALLNLARDGRWGVFLRELHANAAGMDARALVDVEGWTPLHFAATVPPLDSKLPLRENVCALSRFGFDANARTLVRADTALHLACAAPGDNVRVVGALLEVGCDVLLPNGLGETPLLLAMRAANVTVAYFLLNTTLCSPNARACILARDDAGQAPIHVAVAQAEQRPVLLRMVLDCGADCNATTRVGGQTPLHCALLARSPIAVEMLLWAGASLALHNDEGDTVVHLAQSLGPAGAPVARAVKLIEQAQQQQQQQQQQHQHQHHHQQQLAHVPIQLGTENATQSGALSDAAPSEDELHRQSRIARRLGVALPLGLFALCVAFGIFGLFLAVPVWGAVRAYKTAHPFLAVHPLLVPTIVWTLSLMQFCYALFVVAPSLASPATGCLVVTLGAIVLACYGRLTALSSGLYVHPTMRAGCLVPFTVPHDDASGGSGIDAFARTSPGDVMGFCLTCERIRALRAKHCDFCGGCVPVLDHHCGATGACVGAGQHRWFMAYIYATFIFCLVQLRCLFAVQPLSGLPFWSLATSWTLVVSHTHVLFLVIVLLAGGLLTGSLSFAQTWFVARNTTYNEAQNGTRYDYLRDADGAPCNPFDEGPVRNCLAFWYGEDRTVRAEARMRRTFGTARPQDA